MLSIGWLPGLQLRAIPQTELHFSSLQIIHKHGLIPTGNHRLRRTYPLSLRSQPVSIGRLSDQPVFHANGSSHKPAIDGYWKTLKKDSSTFPLGSPRFSCPSFYKTLHPAGWVLWKYAADWSFLRLDAEWRPCQLVHYPKNYSIPPPAPSTACVAFSPLFTAVSHVLNITVPITAVSIMAIKQLKKVKPFMELLSAQEELRGDLL